MVSLQMMLKYILSGKKTRNKLLAILLYAEIARAQY